MIEKIVSGGQTGVDRAALDAALDFAVPIGGWCPKARKAEDGKIPEKYSLMETASGDYRIRTALNVAHSDGTLILAQGKISGGTAYTVRCARRAQKPFIILDLQKNSEFQTLKQWLIRHQITTLNVAGPRESQKPGIYLEAKNFLMHFLQKLNSR